MTHTPAYLNHTIMGLIIIITVGGSPLKGMNQCHGKHLDLIKAKNIKSRTGLLRVKGNKSFPPCGLNDGKNALNISEKSPNRFSYGN